ncbi:ferrous iron transport protein A [Sphingomonas sp. ac-8]|uniref:FeoA family protein n=1 Tax=Sphingomonas sp. ac-8 TaxID=3242977 RepID=UPI003A7FBB75
MLSPASTLSHLARHQHARIATVDWESLQPGEARRLREFGVDEGVEIELLHRAWLGGGPVACRIGRMTVALRPHVAAAIRVAASAD